MLTDGGTAASVSHLARRWCCDRPPCALSGSSPGVRRASFSDIKHWMFARLFPDYSCHSCAARRLRERTSTCGAKKGRAALAGHLEARRPPTAPLGDEHRQLNGRHARRAITSRRRGRCARRARRVDRPSTRATLARSTDDRTCVLGAGRAERQRWRLVWATRCRGSGVMPGRCVARLVGNLRTRWERRS